MHWLHHNHSKVALDQRKGKIVNGHQLPDKPVDPSFPSVESKTFIILISKSLYWPPWSAGDMSDSLLDVLKNLSVRINLFS